MRQRIMRSALTTYGSLFPAATCLAEEIGAPSLGTSSLKAFGSLILVVALILLAAWLAKRYLRFLPQSPGRGEGIQVVSARSLGPKRSVHLIEVEGRRLLVGSSEAGVRLLCDCSPAGKTFTPLTKRE